MENRRRIIKQTIAQTMAATTELLILILAIVASSSASAAAGDDKDTHIKLYWQDILSGPNPTAVQVAQAAGTNTSKTFFGGVMVIDDALTEGPDLNSSKIIGRAQGTYIGAGRDEVSLMMNMNFVFEDGEYNGSTIAIIGRNAVFDTVREMAVVGGTGVFRGARGYAQATTHTLDVKTGDATVDAQAMAAVAVLLVLVLAAVAAPPATGETTTHIKLYWHDVVSGPSPTAVQVARAAVTNTSKSLFGAVVVIDDALTEGPDLNSSKLLGRAQGTYIAAGKDEVSLMMNMNFVFQAGKYNGSTVAILGRNKVFSAVREMSIVGGTGVFRLARGYAQARTHTLDMKTGDATVEYNLFIKH
ncbi:hypothetical protein U9M48_035118 [Paspalum notatum var. saurae]|uniref:Dirigent protein n=1 Tax=Paspalum notatum var. saurae TaxID=547442 RepID=A0AAQ3X7E1_PASNO